MRRTIFLSLLLITALGLIITMVPQASAEDSISSEMAKQLEAAGGSKGAGLGAPVDPRLTVARIIRVALELLGIIFFGLVVYAGFKWMTAGGNEDSVTEAKNLMRQAVIGLIIVLSAYSITLFATKLASGSYTDYSEGIWIEPLFAPKCTGLSCQ